MSLVPQGVGHSVSHLAETVQMGLTSCNVHDVPWVSFKDRFEKDGYVLNDRESEP